MADSFVTYTRKDIEQAVQLASAMIKSPQKERLKLIYAYPDKITAPVISAIEYVKAGSRLANTLMPNESLQLLSRQQFETALRLEVQKLFELYTSTQQKISEQRIESQRVELKEGKIQHEQRKYEFVPGKGTRLVESNYFAVDRKETKPEQTKIKERTIMFEKPKPTTIEAITSKLKEYSEKAGITKQETEEKTITEKETKPAEPIEQTETKIKEAKQDLFTGLLERKERKDLPKSRKAHEKLELRIRSKVLLPVFVLLLLIAVPFFLGNFDSGFTIKEITDSQVEADSSIAGSVDEAADITNDAASGLLTAGSTDKTKTVDVAKQPQKVPVEKFDNIEKTKTAEEFDKVIPENVTNATEEQFDQIIVADTADYALPGITGNVVFAENVTNTTANETENATVDAAINETENIVDSAAETNATEQNQTEVNETINQTQQNETNETQPDIDFDLILAKDVYNISEAVEFHIQPPYANASIVVIEPDGSMDFISGLKFIPAILGRHTVNALLYYGELNERIIKEFIVVGDADEDKAVENETNITTITIANLVNETNITKAVINATEEIASNISEKLNIKKSKGEKIKYNIIKDDENDTEIDLTGTHIKKIKFHNLNKNKILDLGVEDLPTDGSIGIVAKQAYVIDPTALEFDNATVTVTAKGRVLLKCKDWNFIVQQCFGEWVVLRTDLMPGQDYDVTIDVADPAFIETSEAVSVSVAPIDFTSFVVAWVDAVQTDVSFRVMATNGSVILNTVDADTTVDTGSKVSVSMINSTHFVLGWIDGPSNDATFAVYNTTGSLKTGPTDSDANVGINADVSVTDMGDRFAICFADATDSDATFEIRLNDGVQVGVDTDIDISISPGGTLQNLVSCSAINRTRWAFAFYDDTDNDITFAIINDTGATISGPTDLDIDVGETGQVATTSMDNDKFAVAWYDSTDADITIAIRYVNNTVILAPTDIDTNAGTDSRVAMGTVRENSTSTSDMFVVAWYDQAVDDILAGVFYSNGTQFTAPFTVEGTPDSTYFLLAVTGRDPITNNSLCPSTFIVAYTNISNNGTFRGFYVNGTSWDGTCDITPPVVRNVRPTAGTNYTQNTTFNITTNVTDDATIDTVLANVTFPNQTSLFLRMVDPDANSIYEVNFTNASQPGIYNVTILANDTSGKLNNSEKTYFNITDILAPFVRILSPANGTNFNQSQKVNITVNVTDFFNDSVYTVLANITFPNGTIIAFPLIEQSTNNQLFNNTFNDTSQLGTYTLRILANDTSGNLNNSVFVFFVTNDVVPPTPANATEFPIDPATFAEGQFYQFNVSWTDDNTLHTVRIEHNFSGGALTNQSVTGNVSNVTFFFNRTNLAAGIYAWRQIANDTSGNVNTTSQFSYTVNKGIPFVNLTLSGNTTNISVEGFTLVNITARLENSSVGNVELYVNGILINNGSLAVSNITEFNIVQQNNVTAVFSGNANLSFANTTRYVNVTDNTNPNVTIYAPVNGTTFTALPIDLNFTVKEASPIKNVAYSLNGNANTTINNRSNLNRTFETTDAPQITISNANAILAQSFVPAANMEIDRVAIKIQRLGAGVTNPKVQIRPNNASGNVGGPSSWVISQGDINNAAVPGSFEFVNVSLNLTARLQQGTLYWIVLTPQGADGSNNYEWEANNDNLFAGGNAFNNGTNVSGTDFLFRVFDMFKFISKFNTSDGLNNISVNANDTDGRVGSSIVTYFTVDANGPTPSNFTEFPTDPANFSQGQFYQFNVSWVDAGTFVHTVRIEHNFSGGSLTNSSVTGNTSNIMFFFNRTNLAAGIYAWRQIANDSNGNYNQTAQFSYTVNRANATVNLTLNGTDGNITVAQGAIVNISGRRVAGEGNIELFRNGVLINTGSGPLENISQFNTAGAFNITLVYNQTQNFSYANETHFVIVNDTTPPNVNTLRPTAGTNYTQNTIFNITANVTDNVAVQTVIANVTFPNQTSLFLFMVDPDANSIYEVNFTNASQPGIYNVTILANDTTGNLNNTERTYFNITDIRAPAVFILSPSNGTNFNQTDKVNVTVNVTDFFNDSIHTVKANVTHPNGSITIFQLIEQSANNQLFNNTFNDTTQPGTYTLRIQANDTSGNLNNTEIVFFVTLDNRTPFVRILSPANNTTFNQNNAVNVTVNVTDFFNDSVHTVIANVTFPNGSYQTFALIEQGNTQIFNNTFNTTFQPGYYEIRIQANDTSGNLNNTEFVNILVVDNRSPAVFILSPSNGTQFNQSAKVNVTANVTDYFNDSVHTVIANITFPNGSVDTFQLLEQSTNNQLFNNTFNRTTAFGTYTLRILANDTAGNLNNTEFVFFVVADVTPPTITIHSPANLFNTTNSTVNVNFTATNLQSPINCTLFFNSTARDSNASIPNNTAVILNATGLADGIYLWNVSCIDLSGNTNSTPARTLTVDSTGPNTTIDEPDDFENITQDTFTMRANVTDATIGVIDTVIFEYRINESFSFAQACVDADRTAPFSCIWDLSALPDGDKYVVRARANDSLGNLGGFDNSTNITVLRQGPQITLNFPPDEYNTSGVNISFNFTAVDIISTTFNCSIFTNGSSIANGTQNTSNNTATLFNLTNFNEREHSWSVQCIDGDNNTGTSATRTFTVDLSGPTPNNATEFPADPATFARNQSYQFNVTWNDSRNVHTVRIEHNFSGGALVNQTVTGSVALSLGRMYFFNFTNIAAGVFAWRQIANDTLGNTNATAQFSYTVNRRNSTVNLTLNGQDSNITIGINTTINISGVIEVGEGNVELYRNGTLVANGSSPQVNITQFNVNGTFNITAVHPQSQNFSFSNDTLFVMVIPDNINPTVANVTASPAAINQTKSTNITADVTDNLALLSVEAMIRFPNGTVQNISMANISAINYFVQFNATISYPVGTYNATIIAKDTEGNTNDTESTTFTVNDITPPGVVITSPTNGTSFNQSDKVNITANVTDAETNVSTVIANITFPNSSITTFALVRQGSTIIFNNTFNSTTQVGTYTLRIQANDTAGNLNNSVFVFFVINDSTNPVVSLVTPDLIGDNDGNITLVYNVSDDTAIAGCSLFINGAFNKSNNSITKDINQTFALIGFTPDDYLWNVTCSDSNTNNGTSVTRRFVVSNTRTFNGRTTDFGRVNMSNVTNLILENTSFGLINLSQGVNLSKGIDLDGNVSIRYNNITVNSLSVPEINVSGVLTLYNLVFDNPVIFISPENTNQLRRCTECTQLSYVGAALKNLTFNTTHFTTFTVTESSNLTIFDTSDSQTVLVNKELVFFANYTNRTLGKSINGSNVFCAISFSIAPIGPQNMTFNASNKLYEFRRSTSTNGTSSFNVTCDGLAASFSIANATDTFVVTGDSFPPNLTINAPTNASIKTQSVLDINLTAIDEGNLSQIAYSINGGANVSIIAFPLNISYENNGSSVDSNTYSNQFRNISQSFTPAISMNISLVQLRLRRIGTGDPINANVTIRTDSGNKPSGTILAQGTFNNDSVSSAFSFINVTLNTTANLAANTRYWIFLESSSSSFNFYRWEANTSNGFADGNASINGTLDSTADLLFRVFDRFKFKTRATFPDGFDTFSAYANDSFGNIDSETIINIIVDTTPPIIFDVTESADPLEFNNTEIITVNVTDATTSVTSVVLEINSTANSSNISMTKLTGTDKYNGTFTPTVLETVYYRFRVTDTVGNSNTSGFFNFTVNDTVKPVIENISNSPSTLAKLDPGVTVNVTADVFDLLLDTVIFQIKLFNATYFNNTTMVNTAGNRFFVNFTAPEGNFTYRIFANDTNTNVNISAGTNISVFFEGTAWNRTPSDLGITLANTSQEVNLGSINITNEGETNLTYSVTTVNSSGLFAEINGTSIFTFNISAGEFTTLNVNITSPTVEGDFNITIVIDETTGNSTVDKLNTTALLRVSIIPIPVLEVTIINFDPSVVRTQTGVQLNATVKNKGSVASNGTTLNWSIPSDWTLVNGSLNKLIGTLNPGATESNGITVDIPADAAVGNVQINATSNSTEGFSGSASKIVSVSPAPSGGGAVAVGGGRGGGGGGGGGPGAAPKSPFPVNDVLTSVETVEILRGTTTTFPVKVTNTYANSTMVDVRIDVRGFISQYVKVVPEVIDYIPYGTTKSFIVEVTAPSYLNYSEYILDTVITGKVITDFQTFSGNSFAKVSRFITDKRLIKLVVQEVGLDKAKELLEKAIEAIARMESLGIPNAKTSKMLEDAQFAFDERRYDVAQDLSKEVLQISENAFATYELITGIQDKIKKAEKDGLRVDETKKLLNLALAAYEREDFAVALQRAQEVEFVHVLEVRGKVNLLRFAANYWWAVLIALAGISMAGFYSYRRFVLVYIAQRLGRLDKEETSIYELMKDAQRRCFQEKTMGPETYHKTVNSYNERLGKIKNIRAALRAKRVGIMTAEKEVKHLEAEGKNIIALIKDLQLQYFTKRTIGKGRYETEIRLHRERIAELEEERLVAESRLWKKKKGYKIWNEAMKELTRASIFVREYARMKKLEMMLKRKEHTIKDVEKRTDREIEEIIKKKKYRQPAFIAAIKKFIKDKKQQLLARKEVRKEIEEAKNAIEKEERILKERRKEAFGLLSFIKHYIKLAKHKLLLREEREVKRIKKLRDEEVRAIEEKKKQAYSLLASIKEFVAVTKKKLVSREKKEYGIKKKLTEEEVKVLDKVGKEAHSIFDPIKEYLKSRKQRVFERRMKDIAEAAAVAEEEAKVLGKKEKQTIGILAKVKEYAKETKKKLLRFRRKELRKAWKAIQEEEILLGEKKQEAYGILASIKKYIQKQKKIFLSRGTKEVEEIKKTSDKEIRDLRKKRKEASGLMLAIKEYIAKRKQELQELLAGREAESIRESIKNKIQHEERLLKKKKKEAYNLIDSIKAYVENAKKKLMIFKIKEMDEVSKAIDKEVKVLRKKEKEAYGLFARLKAYVEDRRIKAARSKEMRKVRRVVDKEVHKIVSRDLATAKISALASAAKARAKEAAEAVKSLFRKKPKKPEYTFKPKHRIDIPIKTIKKRTFFHSKKAEVDVEKESMLSMMIDSFKKTDKVVIPVRKKNYGRRIGIRLKGKVSAVRYGLRKLNKFKPKKIEKYEEKDDMLKQLKEVYKK